MMRPLFWILPWLGPLASAQEEPVELRWNPAAEQAFSLSWSYSEERRTEQRSFGKASESGGLTQIQDKRVVEAELGPRTLAGRPWARTARLKKVTWTYGTESYEVTVTVVDGKPPVVRNSVKPKDKAQADMAQSEADRRGRMMSTFLGREHVLTVDAAGKTLVIAGEGVDLGPKSLFAPLYLPAPLAEPLTPGKTWKEPLPQGLAGAVEAKVTELPYKAGQVASGAITVKAGASASVVPAAGFQGSGAFSFEREFAFSREGYAPSAKESLSFKKSVKGTGDKEKGTTFSEDVSVSIVQSATIRKK